MHAWLNTLLASIAMHPHWALMVVFLVAFAESVAVIGILVPAAVVMFTAGALIGAGTLDIWLTLGLASFGAVLGDGLSYEVGRAYYHRIRNWRIFRQRATLIIRGEQFIRLHGGKSILFARFMAPVRAIVPFLAGTARMPRNTFYFANIGSAMAWSAAHILPGVVFGESIQLAKAISGRIAIILVLIVALAWFTTWIARIAIRSGMPIVSSWRARALQWAGRDRARRFPQLKHWTSILLDPQKPDSQALLVWTTAFVGSSVLFLMIAKAVVAQGSLVQLDTAVFNMLQALRTEPADSLMVAITELGSVRVLFLASAAIAAWLVLQRCWRMAVYWGATVGVAQGLVGLFALIASQAPPIDLYNGAGHYAFPGGHATSSIIIYGFLAYLVARRRSALTRTLILIIAGVAIALIGISRLYLGAHWLSDVLAGWCFGIAWLALAIIIHTRYGRRENKRPFALGVFAITAIVISGLWTFNYRSSADLARYTARTPRHVIALSQWTDTAWRQLPQRRIELGGDSEELFLLQWAESQDRLRDRLKNAGWSVPPAWSVETASLWLAPNTAIGDLPVLPKYSRGKSSRLAFVMLDPAYPQQRIVLRLWRSDYLLRNPDPQGKTPIWYGAFYEENFKRPWHLFTRGVARNLTDISSFARLLPADLDTVIRPAAPHGPRAQTMLALPQPGG